MYRHVLPAFATVLLVGSCGIGLGDCITAEGTPERRDVPLEAGVTALDNESSLDVDIRYGEVASVTLVAAPNLLDAIEVRQAGGAVTIDTKSGCYRNADWRVEVVTPQLVRIDNDGSGDVDARGLRGDGGALRLHADGSGDINVDGASGYRELDVETGGSGGVALAGLPPLEDVKVVCDGSGGVTVRGATQVERLSVDLDGSGGADLSDLDAREVDAETGGSGSARVTARERLHATADGSGGIRYRGAPAALVVEENGSGRVRGGE